MMDYLPIFAEKLQKADLKGEKWRFSDNGLNCGLLHWQCNTMDEILAVKR